MGLPHPLKGLGQLAGAYGVVASYRDMAGHEVESPPEAILHVLKALGVDVEVADDIPRALDERRQALWKRCLEPVVVAWDGHPAAVELRFPADRTPAAVFCHLQLEDGGERSWPCDLTELPVSEAAELGGQAYAARKLSLPSSLPWGYHRLIVETPGGLLESMIISAPLRAYPSHDGPAARTWGVFLPLYALHSRRSWGSGDFSDLEALMAWVAGLGGGVVATLPLLAAFHDGRSDPSPYAPVSRLFWNELYLDVARAPGLQDCPPAWALLDSPAFQEELEALRALPLADHGRQMALKRPVLEELARCFFAEAADRSGDFGGFLESNPRVAEYAAFRAARERQAVPWWQWPGPLRDGVLEGGDYDEQSRRYHTYVQWLADRQLRELSERAREKGSGLYIDLPLGVRTDGYDVWRERDLFVMGVSAGAPPDTLYSRGQNWAFPPLHPQRIREQGYRYFRDYLGHHLKYAGFLRIDHVMSLHRLFWIPTGFEATEGVYVRYATDELCAILSLETHRHKCCIVGENLGTVPPILNEIMSRHNLRGMYVVQYQLSPGPGQPLPPALAGDVASLNTHDMPPFAAFWRGLDIRDRLALNLLDDAGARNEWQARQEAERALLRSLRSGGWLAEAEEDDVQAVMAACLRFLGATSAGLVLVNLEDLWLETEPQ
ncbi:MAG: 4-alpha-glucanotransferase, partial [Chloroflexi bacterium]|nr:4-alpha-glucanotransferase [Chloroflexota bacterium]